MRSKVSLSRSLAHFQMTQSPEGIPVSDGPLNPQPPPAPRWRNDRGQALLEFAFVLPVLAMLVLGIMQFAFVFHDWVTLADAVRVGSRQLALSRAPNVDGCQAAATKVRNAAPYFNQANLQITWTVTNSCTNLAAGSDATLVATYPCDLTIFGVNYFPGCTLRSQNTERVE